jgi:hypothetical protein
MTLQYELRTPPFPQDLVSKAAEMPGGWVYDIDWSYPPDQSVPPEAIRGSWEVDAQGKLTGRYARNPRYRPVELSERTLKSYMHAAARTNREQWIAEIDPRGERLFPQIPQELIRGWWYVDKNGQITRQFRPNSFWKPAE